MVAEANSVCSGRGLACRLPDDCCTLLTVERLSLGPPSITADPMLMEAEALGTSYHTHARVSSSTAGSTDIRLDTAPIQETMLHNQVALESVRFEIDSIDQVARSPDSRRNVTVSRGSQEAPPLLLSPDVSSPIKKVVSDSLRMSVGRPPRPSSPPLRRDAELGHRSSPHHQAQREAGQEVASPCNDACTPSAKCHDEALGAHFGMPPARLIIFPAIYGYFLLHPQLLPM